MKTEHLTCQNCQSTFQWTPDNNMPEEFVSIYRPRRCEPCEAAFWREREEAIAREKRERAQSRITRLRELIAKETEPLFRGTDTGDPRFNRAGWDKVKDWQPTIEKPWLGLIGETGTCKSRIAYLIAGRVIEAMDYGEPESLPTFAFVTSCELSDIGSALVTGDFESKTRARRYLDHIRRVRFLLVDDLGKGRMSPSIAPEFFSLIDHRYRHQLATVWTANSTPAQIAACMSEDMAGAFAGRLNDSSRIVRFKP